MAETLTRRSPLQGWAAQFAAPPPAARLTEEPFTTMVDLWVDPAGAGGVRGQAHATELLPGRLKDEFYRNRTWRSFEEFKRDLDAYTVHWNKRRQVKQKGLTPEEFRNQSPCAA